MNETWVQEKQFDCLISERALAHERSLALQKLLGGFNPLAVTLFGGAIVAVITRDATLISDAKAGFLAFVASQFALAIGFFNFMLLSWLRVEGRYIAYIESRINSLLNSPNLLGRESVITPKVLHRSSVIPFMICFLLIVIGLGTWSSLYAVAYSGVLQFTVVILVEIAAMLGSILYEVRYARHGIDRWLSDAMSGSQDAVAK